jgi:NTP pyrophosphatase (non-canonical NTP hydrolase)
MAFSQQRFDVHGSLTPHPDLPTLALDIVDRLQANGFAAGHPTATQRQVLALAEEAGEFVGAYRRWSGQARRAGTYEDMCLELADVVITAYVTAAELRMDLDAAITAKLDVIFTRGWREPTTTAPTA